MRKIIFWGLAALLLFSGCAPSELIASPTPEASQTPPPATATAFQPAPATPTSAPPTATAIPRLGIERVLIITVDGLRPDVISLAPMPNLLALMEEGSYSLTAQTIFPSSTLPAHASIFTSMCPAKHGVDWNGYIPENGYALGPNLFEIAHDAGLKTVMIVGKEKLQQITPPENLDIFEFVNDRDSVVAEHAIPIIADGFDLMFIHLPLVDMLGHEYGWMSANYIIGAFRADEAIGMILAALDEAGLREGTLIIITADHGGDMEYAHGGRQPAAMTVPWILTGTSLNSGAFQRPIGVVDTAATVAYALNLSIPAIWDGIPALEAFGEIPPTRVELPCSE
ncbi:MAG: sulfatase-like hydrolase/transferase [Anaerolineae bacterium]|nr:sulfatase-like hydrolase/transferase [Anaerolineae bacterium]MBT7074667.1 sulfatase-like hydrolase/transferase [Anaerolineae bacterium]